MSEKTFYMIQRLDDFRYLEYLYRANTSFDRDIGDALEFDTLEDAKVFLKYAKKINKNIKFRIVENKTTLASVFSEDEDLENREREDLE